MIKPRSRGFTLVELLVVIAIIAVLVSTTAVMAPRIRKKGMQSKSVTNLRQMTTLLTSYANDHSNRMPPPVTPAKESEAEKDTYWYAYLQQEISNKELPSLVKDDWWKQNQTIFQNPLHPKKDLKYASVGYAMNTALAGNIAAARDEELDPADSKFTPVNLATIREPERIPIVMPHWSWGYTCDPREAADKRFKPYTVTDRLPVLFLDGHIDSMTPKEYAKKKLNLAPVKKDD